MKKIMFNDKYGLTKAVLEGRKTQTRRVIKLKDGEYVKVVALDNGSFMSYIAKEGKPTAHVGAIDLPNFVRVLEPRYFIGEEVAVAQSYQTVMRYYHSLGHVSTRTVSEEENTFWNAMRDIESTGNDSAMQGDNNKMFVKANLMPHRIKKTDIRVERLQDISEDDCLKEGVREHKGMTPEKYPKYWSCFTCNGLGVRREKYFEDKVFFTGREAFAALIDKICGKGTWASNPWVFVYDFVLIK